MNTMEGIHYVTDHKNRKIAAQIDLKKYGGQLWEDFLDVIESEARRNEETISLDELKSELKASGKFEL